MEQPNDSSRIIQLRKADDPEVSYRLLLAQKRAERMARIVEAGGHALDNLTGWRRNIPTNDRIQMAINMNSMLVDYEIKPRHLRPFHWKDYPSEEAFRRDLSRMRIPHRGQATKRRLIASASTWVRLLNYLHGALEQQRRAISLESLADKLTRGTRFHPRKKAEGNDGKLRYLLRAIAIKISEETELMQTYQRLAESRAEYLQRYRRNIDEEWANCQYNDWHRQLDPKTTLVNPSIGAELWQDIYYLPRFFIGYQLHATEERIVQPDDDYLSYLFDDCFDEHGLSRPDDIALGPDHLKYPSDRHAALHSGACYLVLYPNERGTQIIPYVFLFSEEGSQMLPYVDDPFDGQFFCPHIRKHEPIVGQTLLERIEDSREELLQSLRETAPLLKQHPYLQWKRQRSQSIDEFLDALLDTSSTSKE